MADAGKHMTKSKSKSEPKLKYTTIVSQVEVTENKQENNISLQEAFKRYRKAKQKEIRKAKLLRKRNELRKADPAKMEALRKKFVDQAKKYFGYPYARKYWPPDSPEYKSKLFLDCCGLVRQVMRDLTYDFGFVIGPWNQAYMYDTLPKTVVREEDMKPGDLVFISATYYNPKSKKQRHNMTHVEIWLGDGPKTIGARWNNGKVQVWDSYKFMAKSYYDETYHFKSLDTWLKGICESFCSLHRWKRRKYNPSKKSIFHVESDQSLQDQDEQAGDNGNDDDDNFTACGDNVAPHSSSGSKSSSPQSLNQTEAVTDGEMLEEGYETDDEMCNASPDSDQGQEESDAADAGQGNSTKDDDSPTMMKEINEDKKENEKNNVAAGSRNSSPPAARSLSVDLNNRGLYMSDLVVIDNAEDNSKQTSGPDHSDGSLAECGVCHKMLADKPEETDNDIEEKDVKNGRENDTETVNELEAQQRAEDQDASISDNLVNSVLSLTVANIPDNSNQMTEPNIANNGNLTTIDNIPDNATQMTEATAANNGNQTKVANIPDIPNQITVPNIPDNANQNSFPRKEEKRKQNTQCIAGARPKTSYQGTSGASQVSSVSGKLFSDLPDEESSPRRQETRMSTLSDISLAGSLCSDKGSS